MWFPLAPFARTVRDRIFGVGRNRSKIQRQAMETTVVGEPATVLQGDDTKYDKDNNYDEDDSENSHDSMLLSNRVPMKVAFPVSI